jgi:hypothetical protein
LVAVLFNVLMHLRSACLISCNMGIIQQILLHVCVSRGPVVNR